MELKDLTVLRGKYTKPKEDSGCIDWIMYRNPAGYGQIRINNKLWLAHRFVYSKCVASIPKGLIVMHKCDNPACINPNHLALGTHLLNVRDKEAKGRGNRGGANPMAKLTCKDVEDIRKRYSESKVSYAQLGREYGVNRSCIFKIVNNHSWTKL